MSGPVTDGLVASFRYRLTDDAGEVIDETGTGAPLSYLHGGGTIFPGLETAMNGRVVGDSFAVVVPPEEAYGPHDAQKVVRAPRNAFPEDMDLEVGMQFVAQSEDQKEIPVWITALEGDQVVVDANHPLCGKTLHFEIEVVGVRDATEEEREKGIVDGGSGELG